MSHAGSTLQLILDLSGTFVFGLNGALTAMEAENLDIVGVVVLAVITALGGGIIRDVLIGSLPPAAFRDWRYLAVGGGATLTALALEFHFYSSAIAIVAAVLCFSIRMAGVHFNLNMPVSHPSVTVKPRPTSEEGS